jgi:hypothetical protein
MEGLKTSLLALLLAEACNIGFTPVIDAGQEALIRGLLKVSGINARIGEPSSRAETNRSRLKRLAAERPVIEKPTGWFSLTDAELNG